MLLVRVCSVCLVCCLFVVVVRITLCSILVRAHYTLLVEYLHRTGADSDAVVLFFLVLLLFLAFVRIKMYRLRLHAGRVDRK